jgi:hypothetical protein
MEKHASVIADLVSAIRKVEKAKQDTPNGLVDDHCVNALGQLFVALRMSIVDIQDEVSGLYAVYNNNGLTDETWEENIEQELWEKTQNENET